MTTPRNNIMFGNDYKSVIEAVDTLYEIAEAELASDEAVYKMWEELGDAHIEYRNLFARALKPKLRNIVARDELNGISEHAIDTVAHRIANDWWEEKELMKQLDTVKYQRNIFS